MMNGSSNEIITHEGVQYRKVERDVRVGDKVVANKRSYDITRGGIYEVTSLDEKDAPDRVGVCFEDDDGDMRAFWLRSDYTTLEPLPATNAKPGDRVRIVAADDINREGYANGDVFTVKEAWDDGRGVDVIDERHGGDFELYAEEFEVVRELRDHHGDTTEGYADRLADALIQAQNGDVRTQKIATAEVTQSERIENACRDLSALLVRKNHDYGDSFAKQYEKYGLTSALIRMDDKLRRLETLNDGEAAQVAESVEDTLIDLAGYALLAAVELRKANAD